MERFRFLVFALALASIAFYCDPIQAQTVQHDSETRLKIKQAREDRPLMPFLLGSESPKQVESIEFRSPDQMTQQDRDLEADAESSIRERVGFEGLEFNEGNWSYQQLVCPVLPNHIFLRFTRNNGVGDVSMFTASIPRGGDGKVRIIPILRRGYSLFSPAPINALTISAFNHIRAEEHSDAAPDWLTTGLCYAALAGAHPQPAQPIEVEAFPAGMPAVLQIPTRGGAIIRFTDMAATPRPMDWNMTFDGKGRLLKASHSPAALVTAKITP